MLALGTVAAIVATLSVIGSDALWLCALGDRIRSEGSIPPGVPFAAATSQDWVNTTALGQLVFSALHLAGSLGIITAQILTVTATLWLLVASALRRGAPAIRTVSVMALVFVGGAARPCSSRALNSCRSCRMPHYLSSCAASTTVRRG